jgi:hypothetical protein
MELPWFSVHEKNPIKKEKKQMIKKLIAGSILSMVVMLMVGTAAFAKPPEDAGIPPANASCIAACSHACVNIRPVLLQVYGIVWEGNNLVPMKANGALAAGRGVSATAQMTIQEECYDILHMTLSR